MTPHRTRASQKHPATRPGAVGPVGGVGAGAASAAVVPGWLRRAVQAPPQNLGDAALAAGAAIGALDTLVRRRERWDGVWRQRLALKAASVTARQAGRVEDSLALRDAVLLTSASDIFSSGSATPGPAGSMLLAWRRLATRPAADLLSEKNLAAMLDGFGLFAGDDEMVSELTDDIFSQLGAGAGAVAALSGAFMAAERRGFGRTAGAWLADAVLARQLGWSNALPLFGTEPALGMMSRRPRRPPTAAADLCREDDPEGARSLLVVKARAALAAIDLFAELQRRAERLLAIAPKLRARGANAIIDRLMNEDALVASRGEQGSGITDRGLRRLFDRLIDLGAVHELSGRPTFRLYGL